MDMPDLCRFEDGTDIERVGSAVGFVRERVVMCV